MKEKLSQPYVNEEKLFLREPHYVVLCNPLRSRLGNLRQWHMRGGGEVLLSSDNEGVVE